MARRQSEGSPVVVDLEGPATIRVVSDVRARIVDAMGRGTDIVIDLGKIERADLSLVQLLFSASVSARTAGARFRVTGAPDIVRSAAGDSHDVDLLYSDGA